MPIQFGRRSTGDRGRTGQTWRTRMRFPPGIPISRRGPTITAYRGIGPGFFSGENLHRQLHDNQGQGIWTCCSRGTHPGSQTLGATEQLCPSRPSQPPPICRVAHDIGGHQPFHELPVTHQHRNHNIAPHNRPQQRHIIPQLPGAPRVQRTPRSLRIVLDRRPSRNGEPSVMPTLSDDERANYRRLRVRQGTLFSDSDSSSETRSFSDDSVSNHLFSRTFFSSPPLINTSSLSSDSMSDVSSLGGLSRGGRGRRRHRARNGLGTSMRDSSSQSRRNWWFGMPW